MLPHSRRTLSACVVALCLGGLASTADAQVRTEGRNIRIAYESGSATRNGYADAQVEVTYYFAVCAGGEVSFLAKYNPVPHMLVGRHRYWISGRMMEVPSHISPPRLENPTIRGTIRGPNTAREINYVYASPASASCFTNDLGIGPASAYWPAGTPVERQVAILSSFGFDQRGTLPPLRSSEAEAYFQQILAAERTDSLNRARAAETQRLAARRDSVSRAQAAQAQRDSAARAESRRQAEAGAATRAAGAVGGNDGATSAGATGAAATAGGAVASSTGGDPVGGDRTAPREPSVEEREAAARAAERADSDRRAEDLRRQQEARAEKARQDSVLAQAGAEAIVAVGMALAPAVNRMFTALEGTGFTLGFNATTSYLPGDAGRMGVSLGMANPTTNALLGFVDFSFELGSGKENVAKSEGVAITLAAPIPRMSMPIGASTLRPHIGIKFLQTSHPDENFGMGVERQLLMLGVTLTRSFGAHLRLESTIWEGKPTFGIAVLSTL